MTESFIREENTEACAYLIAAECLKPIEHLVESNKLQQLVDKIVAALLEAVVDAETKS